MNLTSTLSLVLSALAITVTLAIFISTQLIARRSAAAARRARLIDLVLYQIERAARAYGRPALTRLWDSPERDALLLLPRVAQQLGKGHEPVKRWLISEVAHLLHEPRCQAVFEAQMSITLTLIAWENSTRANDWFQE